MTSTNRKRRRRTERVKQSRLVLTDRDREIIRVVYQFRFLTSNQLTEKFFSSKSKADRRLRELFDHGYLDRIDRPTVSGKSELIYALWKKGAEILCAQHDLSKSELNWKSSRNNIRPDRIDHELEVVSFHLAMDKSVKSTSSISWLFWQDRREIVSNKTWDLLNAGENKSGKLKLIPDAFFGLQTPKGKTVFFLELDRGTESPRVFRQKLLIYQIAFERGLIQKETGLKAFRVLIIVPHEQRLKVLLNPANTNYPLLFWSTPIENLRRQNILTESIWVHAKSEGNVVAIFS